MTIYKEKKYIKNNMTIYKEFPGNGKKKGIKCGQRSLGDGVGGVVSSHLLPAKN